MANYLSQPTQYAQPQSQFNHELALKVLEAKQGRWDINQAKIDATLGEFQNMEFINQEAKENFYENIQDVLSAVNSTGIGDLSDSYNYNQIQSAISSALTPETLKHNRVAQAYNQANAKWDTLMEKHPDKYNDQNREHAFRESGIYDYMQDGDYSKVNLDAMRTVDYSDYNANSLKIVKDIQATRGKEEHTWTDPATGMTRTTKSNYLTRSDIIMMSDQLYNDKDRRQMQIEASNAVARGGEQGKQTVIDNLERLNKITLSTLEGDIKDLQNYKNLPGTTQAMVDEADRKIKEISKYKTTLENRDYSELSNAQLVELQAANIRNKSTLTLAESIGVEISISRTIPASILTKMHNTKKEKEEELYLPRTSQFSIPIDQTGSAKDAIKFHKDNMKVTTDQYHEVNKQMYEELKRNNEGIFNGMEKQVKKDYKDKYGDDLDDTTTEGRQALIEGLLDTLDGNEKFKNNPNYYSLRQSRAELKEQIIQDQEVDKRAQELINLQTTPLLVDELWKSRDIGTYGKLGGKRNFTYFSTQDGQVVTTKEYFDAKGITTKEKLIEFLESSDSDELRNALQAQEALTGLGRGNRMPFEGVNKAIGAINSYLEEQGSENTFADIFEISPSYLSTAITGIGRKIIGKSESDPTKNRLNIRVKDDIEIDKPTSILINNIGRKIYSGIPRDRQTGENLKNLADITKDVSKKVSDVTAQVYNEMGIGHQPEGIIITVSDPKKEADTVSAITRLVESPFSIEGMKKDYTSLHGKDVISKDFVYNPKSSIRIYKEPRAGDADVYAISQLHGVGDNQITNIVYRTEDDIRKMLNNGESPSEQKILNEIFSKNVDRQVKYQIPYEVDTPNFKFTNSQQAKLNKRAYLSSLISIPADVERREKLGSRGFIEDYIEKEVPKDKKEDEDRIRAEATKVALDNMMKNIEEYKIEKKVTFGSIGERQIFSLVHINPTTNDRTVISEHTDSSLFSGELDQKIMSVSPESYIINFVAPAVMYSKGTGRGTDLNSQGEIMVKNLNKLYE